MKVRTIFFSIIIINLLIIFNFGCQDATSGIFYSVEKESANTDEDRGLPDGGIMHGMVLFNSQYYLANGQLWTRNPAAVNSGDSGYNWTKKSLPGNLANVTAIATDGTDLYIGGYADSSSGITTEIHYSSDGSNWTEVANITNPSSSSPQGGSFQGLFSAGTYVFASIRSSSSNNYLLYYLNSGAPTDVINGESTTSFRGIANSGGTNFSAVNQDTVWNATNITGDDFASISGSILDSTENYTRIKYLGSTSYLIITSSDGYVIYSSDGGTNWYQYNTAAGTTAVAEEVSDEAYGFTDVAYYDSFLADPERFIFASDNLGIAELTGAYIGNTSADIESYGTDSLTSNIFSTPMYRGGVYKFFFDSTASREYLFALTFNEGLWRGSDSGSSGIDWVKE